MNNELYFKEFYSFEEKVGFLGTLDRMQDKFIKRHLEKLIISY